LHDGQFGTFFESKGRTSVIVELFGPPGAGKTTFSHALAARLRDAGRTVDVHLSARPGEEIPTLMPRADAIAKRSVADPLRRLMRPLLELIAAITTDVKARDPSTETLVSKLPRGHRVAALRMRQYLIRLSAAWREALQSERIVIFDQGYVQAISSILLTNQRMPDEDVTTMLSVVPQSDLAIRVEAPIEEIESRLKRREEAIGWLGRLFESKLGEPTDHVCATDRVQAGLKRTGRAVLNLNSADPEMLGLEIERARLEISRVPQKEAAE
jgi:thymidylate kinase